MILRRVIEHVKAQNWTAVALDFVIVVVGVFVGIQVANWNEARGEQQLREQIVAALVTDLRDSNFVLEGQFIGPIDRGLAEWEAAFNQGEQPPPFFVRIDGSDMPPDTWSALVSSQLAGLFDPVTFFDLGLYYSELQGFGVRYIRYQTFVENEVLPGMKESPLGFYRDDQSRLRPKFEANMDRVLEIRDEAQRLTRWAECLIYRLEAERAFEDNCLRAQFSLDGQRVSGEVE